MDSYTLRVFQPSEPVETSLVKFIFEHGVSKAGNTYLLSKDTFKNRIVCQLKDGEEYLVFSLAIPHTISLMKNKFKTCLTTLRTVNANHRNEKLSRKIIEGLVSYSSSIGIFTGYHYIFEPRLKSNIPIQAFFRSLNNEKAREAGYEIEGYDFAVPEPTQISISPITFEEFDECNFDNRKLTIKLEESEFDNLSFDCEIVKFEKSKKIIGVAIFKPVILYIGKTKNSVKIVRLVYFECIDKFDYLILSKLINYLQQKNFTVLSGLAVGVLSDDNLRRKLGMVTSGKMYLDFHNISAEETVTSAKDVSLLYM